MGFIFSKLFSMLFGDKSLKILILGLDNAGKTTMLYRLKLGKIVQTVPTTGFNLENVKYEGLKFEVWDVGGQINLRPYWKNYFPETDCVIFVVDSTDRKRMETVKNEIMYLDSQSELENVPFCICANKQDLVDKALSEFDISLLLELDSIKSREWQIFKVSCKSGFGLDIAFKWVSKIINQKTKNNDNHHDEIYHKLVSDEEYVVVHKDNKDSDNKDINNVTDISDTNNTNIMKAKDNNNKGNEQNVEFTFNKDKEKQLNIGDY